MLTSLIKLENVSKIYKTKEVETIALDQVNLTINEGEFVVIIGDSGSGKTTILNLIGALDKPTAGNIYVNNENITKLNNKKLNDYRANMLGIVFQNYNLIKNLSVLENLLIMKDIKKDLLDPKEILKEVGLENKENAFPLELSGGQSQRVAIARALVKKPKLLLCDEPTGALDYENSKNIMILLRDLNKKNKITTIIVTHNQAFTKIADKVIKLKSGHIEYVNINESPLDAKDLTW